MSRQLRNIPSTDRVSAVLDAFHAVLRTGSRTADVTYDNAHRGHVTTRCTLIGPGFNLAGTGTDFALIVREDDLSNLCEFIPYTRLISITPVRPVKP